ncbi:hypothetical protein CSUB01_04171 [Colletotrichum sublineola]|uniref:Uncharacterized protein n=1 Tax=Colletotrichum sublineola TaxID=1173701 RepID=A0A066WXZ9_COLSU|nr:hypothetical protein CSUB01_04171 [Colletotrichum sublineola]
MRSSDSSEGEAHFAAHHLPEKDLFSGIKALIEVARQQHNGQTAGKYPSLAQQADRFVARSKASDTTSTAKQPSPLRNQLLPPLDVHITPVFRQSATPMPVQKNHADTSPGRIYRTPLVSRSNAPSVSDTSVTVRSQSRDKQDNLIHPPSMRSPSWSPLTTPPDSPLASMTDAIDEDVDCRRTSSQPTSPVGRQPHDQTFDSETAVQQQRLNNRPPRTPSPRRSRKSKPRNPQSLAKGQSGRMHTNRGRRQAASARWSPVIPWSPNQKASFHYDLEQRLAAATNGTHIDNGLFKVTLEYFDV